MKLLHAQIYDIRKKDSSIELANASDLSSFSFWSRHTVREHLDFASRTIVERTAPGHRASVEQPGQLYKMWVYVRTDGFAATLVTDSEYPERVAFSFLYQILTDFKSKYGYCVQTETPSFLQEAFSTFQNPKDADKILKIQDTLEDIKLIVHKNIEEVLRRGEKIEDLVAKSADLSDHGRYFFHRAKEQNKCCKAW